jgi:microcin C transport system permease protein
MWKQLWIFKRSKYSVIYLLTFAFLSLTADFWSNSSPLIVYHNGEYYFPAFKNYTPRSFGIKNLAKMEYKNLVLASNDWILWPLNRHSPTEINKSEKSYPAPPSINNWLGTDDRGRDILARILFGFRYSLLYALSVWFFSCIIAVFYGSLMGYFGGIFDLVGQRAAEVLSTIPWLLLLIFFMSIFEASLGSLIFFSTLFAWIGLSFQIRGEVLRNRESDYVLASRALGAGRCETILKHILPNSLTPLFTLSPFLLIGNIVGLAGMEYLGFGLPPPTPSWGELLQQSQSYFTTAWWIAVFPSLALFLILLSLSFVGEGLRLAYDPRNNAPLLRTKKKRSGSKLILKNKPAFLIFSFFLCGQAMAFWMEQSYEGYKKTGIYTYSVEPGFSLGPNTFSVYIPIITRQEKYGKHGFGDIKATYTAYFIGLSIPKTDFSLSPSFAVTMPTGEKEKGLSSNAWWIEPGIVMEGHLLERLKLEVRSSVLIFGPRYNTGVFQYELNGTTKASSHLEIETNFCGSVFSSENYFTFNPGFRFVFWHRSTQFRPGARMMIGAGPSAGTLGAALMLGVTTDEEPAQNDSPAQVKEEKGAL